MGYKIAPPPNPAEITRRKTRRKTTDKTHFYNLLVYKMNSRIFRRKLIGTPEVP